MQEAEVTAVEVNKTSEEYRPVAKRASLLYFCLADMANVDPMYQYALPWFKALFATGVGRAPASNDMEQRLENLNVFFTYFVYTNVRRRCPVVWRRLHAVDARRLHETRSLVQI